MTSAGTRTGFLIEAAWGNAQAHTVRAYGDPDRWGDLIVARAEELRRHGVTAVHDTTVSPSADAVYRSLATSGRLPISVLAFPHSEAILTGLGDASWEMGPTGEGDEAYRTGPIKLFADGDRTLPLTFAFRACATSRARSFLAWRS